MPESLDILDHDALQKVAQFTYGALDWSILEEKDALMLMSVYEESKKRAKKAASAITSKPKESSLLKAQDSGEVMCPSCGATLRLEYPRAILSDKTRRTIGEVMIITGFCSGCNEMVEVTCSVKGVKVA